MATERRTRGTTRNGKILITMGDRSKTMILGGAAVAAVATLLAVLDLIAGFPYGGQMVMDILFLIAGAIVLYMSYDAFMDLR